MYTYDNQVTIILYLVNLILFLSKTFHTESFGTNLHFPLLFLKLTLYHTVWNSVTTCCLQAAMTSEYTVFMATASTQNCLPFLFLLDLEIKMGVGMLVLLEQRALTAKQSEHEMLGMMPATLYTSNGPEETWLEEYFALVTEAKLHKTALDVNSHKSCTVYVVHRWQALAPCSWGTSKY